MRKIIFLFSLVLAVTFGALAAETLTLMDGSMQAGDIVKFDDNGLMLRTAADVYTNVPWGQLSQDSLKHLTENPKIKPLVEVFIEPDASERPAKAEVRVNPVTRMERPAKPSLFGGLVGSPDCPGVLITTDWSQAPTSSTIRTEAPATTSKSLVR